MMNHDMPVMLDFQKFDDISTNVPPTGPIDINPKGLESSAPDQNQPKVLTLWNIEFYQQFFDVDTNEVVDRIKWSVIPYGNFLQNFIKNKPDLYGPFWICITLIFATAITGNIADYFQSAVNHNGHWKYEFHTTTTVATVIFFYGWILPCVLWAALRWYGSEHEKLKLIEIISLYGYCLSIFIPLSALWLIPYRWFQWIVTIIGASSSGLVLTKSIYPIFTKKMYPLLLLLLLLHVYVASMFMINFFHVAVNTQTDPTPVVENVTKN